MLFRGIIKRNMSRGDIAKGNNEKKCSVFFNFVICYKEFCFKLLNVPELKKCKISGWNQRPL